MLKTDSMDDDRNCFLHKLQTPDGAAESLRQHSPLSTTTWRLVVLSLNHPGISTRQQYVPLSVSWAFRMVRDTLPFSRFPFSTYFAWYPSVTFLPSVQIMGREHLEGGQASRPQHTDVMSCSVLTV